jgi:molybdenum-dependent DNA-binding transcriptional regulator ModE
LGYHGTEKGEKYIEEIQTIMKDAEEYLQETKEERNR